jgi:hypothetical protein
MNRRLFGARGAGTRRAHERCMRAASIILLVAALLGAFDVFYFHERTAKLASRPECRAEVVTHVARGFIYVAQMLVVPNVELHGAWLIALGALYAVDVAVALTDVFLEPASRAPQGGLPRGEYVMHIVLSLLVGAYLTRIAESAIGWAALPTAIVASSGIPTWLRVALATAALGCFVVAVVDLARLLRLGERVRARLGRPRPLHVRVRLRGSIDRVWDVTQDHVLHPKWDHRFSRIEMLSPDVRTGTEMNYEKDIGPFTIRGRGRYALHRPKKQSTFEFWSDSPMSLIRRGIGLWLYREVSPDVVEFATSYTYDVRYGLLGEILDRLVFRPLFQRETERSFVRLGNYLERVSPVVGRVGRKPVTLGPVAA